MKKYSKSDVAEIIKKSLPASGEINKCKRMIQYWTDQEIIRPLETEIRAGQRRNYSEEETLLAVIANYLNFIGFSSDSIIEATIRIRGPRLQGDIYMALRDGEMPTPTPWYLSLGILTTSEEGYVAFRPEIVDDNSPGIPSCLGQIIISLSGLFLPIRELMLDE